MDKRFALQKEATKFIYNQYLAKYMQNHHFLMKEMDLLYIIDQEAPIDEKLQLLEIAKKTLLQVHSKKVVKKLESIANESKNCFLTEYDNTVFQVEVEQNYVYLDAIKNPNDKLFIAINSLAGKKMVKNTMTRAVMDRLIRCSRYTYLTSEFTTLGAYKEICGDICFQIDIKDGKIEKYHLTGSVAQPILEMTQYYKNAK